MDTLRKMYVKANEFARGQTMTEYALILAAVAMVVYAGYQSLGTTINSALSTVDGKI
jgi:Flp pilus assembly pilin Flp